MSDYDELEHRFLILKWDDIGKSLAPEQENSLDEILAEVEDYRRECGKVACPDYYVVNQDEPYAEQVKALVLGQSDQEWAGTPEQEIETLRGMVERRDERITELRQCLKEARAQGGEAVAWWIKSRDGNVDVRERHTLTNDAINDARLTVRPLVFGDNPQLDKWTKCSERLPTEGDEDEFGRVAFLRSLNDRPVLLFGELLRTDKAVRLYEDSCWMPTGLTRPNPPEQESE